MDTRIIKFGELFQEQISRKKLKNTDEVVFIGMQDVDENATIKNFTILDYSKVKSGFTYFEKNDVLVAKITPCFENGKGGFAENIPTAIGFGSTEFHILRASENADARYVYYQTKRPKFRLALEGEMVGSAGHRRVPFSAIQDYELEVRHSKQEQTAIANALTDVDTLITALEKLIDKKTAIKTATMQQLLTGKKRLPPFDQLDTGYKQTELGEIPKDWEVKRIGDFTDCTAGGTPSTSVSSYWGGFHPWMSSGELHLKKVFDVSERITDIGLANSSTKYVPANSVLIGLAGQGKTRGTVAIAKINLCTNQSIAAIFPSEKHCTEYLYYNLDNRYEELRGLSTGDGGRGGLNLSIIRNVLLLFPSIVEQTAIANVLSDMDAELDALQQRLAKTQYIKQGMMQELLTGKTRMV